MEGVFVLIKKRQIKRIIKDLGIKTKNYWRDMLGTIPNYEVGVIKASENILEGKNLQQLCAEIAYLCKETDFYLPLVIEPRIRYDKLPSAIKPVKGVRVITKEMMDEIIPKIKAKQDEVIQSLKDAGVDAVAIDFEEIRVTPLGETQVKRGEKIDVGYFGEVVTIDTKPIIQAIHEKKIPVIADVGTYKDDYYETDATDLSAELVKFLQAKKLIIIGEKPITESDGKIIKQIYSEIEFIKLTRNGTIKKSLINSGREAYDMLNYMGPGHSVQITSLHFSGDKLQSTGLLEELLGNGSGTILLIPHVVTGYPLKVLKRKFLEMIEEKINLSFKPQKKKLVKKYFNMVSKKDATLYLDPKINGGAVSYIVDDFEYMCKLFTDKNYEGLGLGTSIIEHIFLQKGNIVWRTSVKNKETVKFYKKIIEHYQRNEVNAFAAKKENYWIFGIGIKDEKKEKTINKIARLRKTFDLF